LGAAVFLAALILTGCGGDDEKADAGDTTTTTEATTSTSEATTTSEPGETTTTEAGSQFPDKTVPEGEVDESGLDPWQRTALPYRGQTGEQVEVECPAPGTPYAVWGVNVYTDDSSVCTAAVQVGLITFDDGGTVTIEIMDGAEEYLAGSANGVNSSGYGSWGGSFSFPDADEVAVDEGIPWNRQANFYADQGDADVTVTCSEDGTPYGVWGTDVYTDDSSICTAAVHAGLITVEDGGDVTFHLIAGQDAYEGSERNGITSSEYGSWNASFEFVEDPA
jgi:phage baseplate assembly protein gpV